MAKVTNISLDEGMPETVTLELTTLEAATIAKLCGVLVPSTPESSELYNALNGELFNRFYDAGVNEVPGLPRIASRLYWQEEGGR